MNTSLIDLQDLLGWHTSGFVFSYPNRPSVLRLGLAILRYSADIMPERVNRAGISPRN